MLDTQECYKTLLAAGFTEQQADAQATALGNFVFAGDRSKGTFKQTLIDGDLTEQQAEALTKVTFEALGAE